VTEINKHISVLVKLAQSLVYHKPSCYVQNQLWYVLAEVSRELFGFLIIFLIIYLAFVVVGYLIFGHQLETYRTIFASFGTLTNAIIGKNSIADLFTVQPVLGRVYYFLLVFFILWILITMLNATLNVGITSVHVKC
jgi:hypothetical protein